MEQLHQVIWNMLVNKYLYKKVFDYMYPWAENLASIAWVIRASSHFTFPATPCLSIFGIEIILNLVSFVEWIIITAGTQRQSEVNNVQENARRITHDYTVGDLVYVEITGTYRKLDDKKQGPYRIKEVFTNVNPVKQDHQCLEKWTESRFVPSGPVYLHILVYNLDSFVAYFFKDL